MESTPAQPIIVKLKVIVLGDCGVGKSSLLVRYIEGRFPEDMKPTLGVDFLTKTVERPGKRVVLQLWDTGGQERFRNIGAIYYRGSNLCLLVYDPSKRESFRNLNDWLTEFRQSAPEHTPLLVLRNKLDLATSGDDPSWVTLAEAQEWCKTKGLQHFGLSAKTGVDVNDVFEVGVTEALKVWKEPPPCGPVIFLNDGDRRERNQCCCSILAAPPEHFDRLREACGMPKQRAFNVVVPEEYTLQFGGLRKMLSVDLLGAVKEYIRFLEKIERKYSFLLEDEKLLQQAFMRYQNFLLLARLYPGEQLYPLIDIQLVWKAHLIRPAIYEKDTDIIVGRVLEHREGWKPKSPKARKELLARTAELYEKEFKQPYIPTYLSSQRKEEEGEEEEKEKEETDSNFINLLSFGPAKVKKDGKWLPNLREHMVSVMGLPSPPHLLDPDFLERSFREYEQFLLSRKELDEGAVMGGPPYHVDLFWHAHMLHPVEYKNDCVKLLGKIVQHDPWPKKSLCA